MFDLIKKQKNNINLILPKNFVDVEFGNKQRLYFLAGPIRGAGDWQKEAIKMIAAKDKNCYIVCPCRYDENHELYKYSLAPKLGKKNLEKFPNQTMWERYYLELASYYGAIVFWLPLESKTNPRAKEDGPYARDTMGEIGRWSIRHSYGLGLKIKGRNKKRVNFIIGAEEEFPGLKVIMKNLNADHGKKFKINNTLNSTINSAIRLAKKR
jgi:hypothetical protein